MSDKSEKARGVKFDPSKIKGPYPLLAVVLLVAESLLGYWFHIAGGAVERVVAGILMTLTFAGITYAAIALQQLSRQTVVQLPAAGPVEPASSEAKPIEASQPSPDEIVSPDGSYLIAKPPGDWIVEAMTADAYVASVLDISPADLDRDMRPSSGDVMVFRSPRKTWITPLPGQSRVNGRLLPTALQISVPATLVVASMEREQPPLFEEKPFEHNFQLAMSQATRSTIVLRNIASGRVPSTNRRFLQADFRQDLEKVLIDGSPASAAIHVSLIGIEGDVSDYLLSSRYVEVNPGSKTPDPDLQSLKALINSFRPIRLLDPTKTETAMRAKAEERYKAFIAEAGEAMFYTELSIFAKRLRTMDLDDPRTRLHVMEALKPFEMFAKEAGVSDDDLDGLWTALKSAESGNASDLKTELHKLIEAVESPSSPPALPPSA